MAGWFDKKFDKSDDLYSQIKEFANLRALEAEGHEFSDDELRIYHHLYEGIRRVAEQRGSGFLVDALIELVEQHEDDVKQQQHEDDVKQHELDVREENIPPRLMDLYNGLGISPGMPSMD